MLRPAVALAGLVLAALPALAQQQPELVISCENPTFARDTSNDRLVAAFGKDNVRVVEEKGPEGMPPNVKSVIYPKDPKRRLEVSWHDGRTRARPFAFMIMQSSQWTAPLGVRIGSTLEELEVIDGAPFHITGFGGLRDGMAGFTGKLARLPGGCSVGGNLAPTAKLPKREMNRITGDDDFMSSDPIMRRAKPKAHQVDVTYQP